MTIILLTLYNLYTRYVQSTDFALDFFYNPVVSAAQIMVYFAYATVAFLIPFLLNFSANVNTMCKL